MIRRLLLALLTACAAHPVYAQRMCATVASPTRADTGKRLVVKSQPTPTSPNAVCLHKDTVAVVTPPIVTPPRDTAPPVTTTPPVGGSNEPAGMTKLNETSAACWRSCGDGWNGFAQSFSGALTLETDSTAPRSPPTVIVQHFTSVLPGGSSPGAFTTSARNSATLYIAYWMKLSPNFVNHPSNVNKTVFFPIGGYNAVYTMLRGAGADFSVAVGLQGLSSPYFAPNTGLPDAQLSVNLAPNVGNVVIKRGVWYKYEVLLDVPTGSVSVWVNGTAVIRNSGINFQGASARWEEVNWGPIWGGRDGAITTPFYASMDHIYVSGK